MKSEVLETLKRWQYVPTKHLCPLTSSNAITTQTTNKQIRVSRPTTVVKNAGTRVRGCNATWTCTNKLTFRRHILNPSSGSWHDSGWHLQTSLRTPCTARLTENRPNSSADLTTANRDIPHHAFRNAVPRVHAQQHSEGGILRSQVLWGGEQICRLSSGIWHSVCGPVGSYQRYEEKQWTRL
jgi:hypothetical protein